jgi:hypothetical protein
MSGYTEPNGKAEGTPRKLATATQPQFPRTVIGLNWTHCHFGCQFPWCALGLMNWKRLWRNSGICLEGLRKPLKSRTANVRAEILKKHLPNTSLEHYQHANRPGYSSLKINLLIGLCLPACLPAYPPTYLPIPVVPTCSIGHLWNALFHLSFLILDSR